MSDLTNFCNENTGKQTELNRSMEVALQDQARSIWQTYCDGNKSTARVMLNGIPHQRKCYVTAWVMGIAADEDQQAKAYQLIVSVTQ